MDAVGCGLVGVPDVPGPSLSRMVGRPVGTHSHGGPGGLQRGVGCVAGLGVSPSSAPGPGLCGLGLYSVKAGGKIPRVST